MGYLDLVGVGDARLYLAQVPDCSVDACVTDAPYGLGSPPNPYDVMKAWCAGEEFSGGARVGFMGSEWDAFVPGPAIWREVYRVLKPGARCLVFAGTRTVDWMGMALRFAGFDVTDCLMWVYATGFPKSLDISKAIDKCLGGPVPVSEVAAMFSGFGTALKPAVEPILLAQKPIEGTYAENALKWGCGGMNIEASRIAYQGDAPTQEEWNRLGSGGGVSAHMKQINEGAKAAYARGDIKVPTGRWPSNLLLTHHPECVSRGAKTVKSSNPGNKVLDENAAPYVYGDYKKRSSVGHAVDGAKTVEDLDCHADCPCRLLDAQSGVERGGASRFFYSGKAPMSERVAYCRQCKQLCSRDALGDHDGHDVAQHPTQKPIGLMQYLVKLVTPPGGVVLDPFVGSGTTAVAAKMEGMHFIACDLVPEHALIAEARLAQAGSTETIASSGGAFFCPGCKAKGELKLIGRDVAEALRASSKKTTCPKCLKRFSYADLTT